MPDRDLISGPTTRGHSVRGHLAIFALALSLPIVCLAALLFWQVATNERNRLESDASDTARMIVAALDRDIAGLMSSLEVLSLSAYIQQNDLESFYRQADQLGARQGMVPILTDLQGQQLVNLRLPWGTPLPKSTFPFAQMDLVSGRPFVTDLFRGAVAVKPIFAVGIPVMRDGQPVATLSFSLETDRLSRLLAEAELPPSWVATVIDSKGHVMARTRAQDEFIGKEVDPITKAAIAGRSGTWEGKSLDGKDIFGTYARSGLTDYRVAIGVAKADLNAPIVQSLSLFAAIGVVIAGLSTLLAFYFGARVTAPIVALSHQAASLGRGEAVQPLSTSLLEANEVGAEISRAAEALRERQADLREANDEIQRFAYIVSHDLRSPLVNIMGFTTELEALRDDMAARIAKLRAGPDAAPAILGNAPMAANVGPNDDEVFSDFDEAIGFIKASINKMDRLINAVLHLSRQGRRDFKPERIDMGAMVQGIRDSMAHQVAENGTEISVGALPAVLSDRLALEQVFSNLLDNAVKYLRPGVPGRITVAGRATPGGMVYEVRDNGRGIDAKDRERVFELFRRSGVQDRPGEGIGLAHVRSLVRRLGGQITLASEFGQGSTFTITLPRRWPGERKKDAA